MNLKRTQKMNVKQWLALLSGASVLAGCNQPVNPPEAQNVTPLTVPRVNFTPNAVAGVPVAQSTDTTRLTNLGRLALQYGPARPDPFALRPDERRFDEDQEYERIFQSTGGFTVQYEAPVETAPQVFNEPQPYRRLSGIVQGDTITALLELENGTTVLVRPGMRVPNTNWTVVAIDNEKATLRRPGNVLPRQITVRLESPPAGLRPPTQQPGQFPPGGPPFGPGGVPPGFNPGQRPGGGPPFGGSRGREDDF